MILSNTFTPLVNNKARYLLLYGGSGSGKSEFAGRKIFLRCRLEGGHRFLVMRKIRNWLYSSVIKVMHEIMVEEKIDYTWNDTKRIMRFPSVFGVQNEVLFDGLDDPMKIKSIKGITGFWLEEFTEFTKRDFIQLDFRLRGPTPSYKQIIMTFNPDETVGSWIKDMFFEEKPDDYTGAGSFASEAGRSFLHHSTIDDNPLESERKYYKVILDQYDDPTLQAVYRRGQWAAMHGQIFPEWSVGPLPSADIDWYDDVWLGGDFGYSVNPTAAVLIYRKARRLWFEEIIYKAGLTNQEIALLLKSDPRVDVKWPSYWDSAEPKSIDELYKEGINAKPSLKGRDSVAAGIQFLKGYDCTIEENSTHIIGERKKYRWAEDKNGQLLNEPTKTENHMMDGIRYGAHTHLSEGGRSFVRVAKQPMLRYRG